MSKKAMLLVLLSATISLSGCQGQAPQTAPQAQAASAFDINRAKAMSHASFDGGSADGAAIVFGLQGAFAGTAPGQRKVQAFKEQVAKYKVTLIRNGNDKYTFPSIDVEHADNDWGDGVAKCTFYNLKAGQYKINIKALDKDGYVISEGGAYGQTYPYEGHFEVKAHEMLGAQEKNDDPYLSDIKWSDYVPLICKVKLIEDYAMIPGAGITKNIHAIEKYTKMKMDAKWTHHQSRRAKSEGYMPISFYDAFFDDESNMQLDIASLDYMETEKPSYVVFQTDGQGNGPEMVTYGKDVVKVAKNDHNNGLPYAGDEYGDGSNRTMKVQVSPNQFMDFYFDFAGDLKGVSKPYGGPVEPELTEAPENLDTAVIPEVSAQEFFCVDPEYGDTDKYYSSYTGPEGRDAKYYFMQDHKGTIISCWIDAETKKVLGITIPSPQGNKLTHVQLLPAYQDSAD
jgi:hypothetical protein